MMILPLLLIMILPKMMNDPETRKVWEIRCFYQTYKYAWVLVQRACSILFCLKCPRWQSQITLP